MHMFVTALLGLLLFLPISVAAQSDLCQTTADKGYCSSTDGTSQSASAISPDEYAVYESLLKQYHEAAYAELNKQTFKTDIDAKAAAFLKGEGVVLDDTMIADFNEKNRTGHALSQSFVDARKGLQFQGGGRDNVELSRAGLDSARKKAVVFARSTHIQQKAFHQQACFILLEHADGSWTITKKILAGQRYY